MLSLVVPEDGDVRAGLLVTSGLSLPLPADAFWRRVPLLLDLQVDLHFLRLVALLIFDAKSPVREIREVCANAGRNKARRLRQNNGQTPNPAPPRS